MIKVEDAISNLQYQTLRFEEGTEPYLALKMAIKALQEQKIGKWIFGSTMGHSWMKCSECCKSQDGQTLCFTYCPNCGAKMKGAEE